MPLILRTIPCLNDNYAFLIHDPDTKSTALIDAPEAPPILAALKAEGWTLTDILLTHHHYDHIDGVPELVAATNARVTGASADAHRLPPLDFAVAEGDTIRIGGHEGQILDVSGHTLGHIAFYFPAANLLFSADSLMAMGCGRLFEGAPEVMWTSLSKMAALPPETLVCSGHEYTEANLKFAQSLDPDHPALVARAVDIAAKRAQGAFTVPSLLSEELATNPFLRVTDPAFKSKLGMADASDSVCFAHVRALKDNF